MSMDDIGFYCREDAKGSEGKPHERDYPLHGYCINVCSNIRDSKLYHVGLLYYLPALTGKYSDIVAVPCLVKFKVIYHYCVSTDRVRVFLGNVEDSHFMGSTWLNIHSGLWRRSTVYHGEKSVLSPVLHLYP